ncbi:hypothetical protein HDU67_005208 [Dinochytrium kinnereticum]|nr:hypothetical protein HDU67_005208 [Dinochytrium kinnereticum]
MYVSLLHTTLQTPDPLTKLQIEDDEEEKEIRYARLLVRLKEKEGFVESIGSPGVTNVIVHIAQSIPGLLQEMWECVDMAVLASKFFGVVTRWLDILKIYDTNGCGTARDEDEYLEVVREMEAAVWGLFEAGYPLVYQLAQRDPCGPEGIHAIVDFIAREFGVTLLNDPDEDWRERQESAFLFKTIPSSLRKETVSRARWSFSHPPIHPPSRRPSKPQSPTPLSDAIPSPDWVPPRKSILHLGCPSDRLLDAYESAGIDPTQLWVDADAIITTLSTVGVDERCWSWGFQPSSVSTLPKPSPHLLTTGLEAFREIMIADFLGREGRGWHPRPDFRGKGGGRKGGGGGESHSDPDLCKEGRRSFEQREEMEKGRVVGSHTIAMESVVRGKGGGVTFGREEEKGKGRKWGVSLGGWFTT